MKKTVFISSTYEDLKQHRAKLWDTISQYDVDIRGMEQFGARKSTPLETCLAEVEQSDIYIGIVALRLGSIDEKSGKSFTQLEYERARKLDKEILIYFLDKRNGLVTPKFIDFGENHEKLNAFKTTLRKRHTIDTFVDENDLSDKLKRKLDDILTPKTEKAKELDEYSSSKDVLKKVYLMPKAYSGKEIKLKLKFEGSLFPASKSICESFNLEYGKTVGTEVKLIEPKIDQNIFEHIFITNELFEKVINVKEEQELDVFAKIEFSENNIEKVKANFVETNYFDSNIFKFSYAVFGNRKTIPAEGKICLILTDIIEVIQN